MSDGLLGTPPRQSELSGFMSLRKHTAARKLHMVLLPHVLHTEGHVHCQALRSVGRAALNTAAFAQHMPAKVRRMEHACVIEVGVHFAHSQHTSMVKRCAACRRG